MLKLQTGLRLLCLLFVCATLALAQLPTGTILGVVKDSSGGVVPDAHVTIVNVETDFTRTVNTSDDGAFRVPALPVGRYTVKIEKEGFKTQTQTGLTLEVSEDLVLNSALELGTSQQQVMVTSEAPVVNTTTSSLGGLVNEQRVEDLPLNGRNWIDLTLLQPGITRHTNLGGGSPIAVLGVFFSANGATTHSNNFMLDGAMMVNIQGANQSSVSSSSLGVDGIREYKVETNSFSAEYGLSMGSQTTIVSKGGSNTWHGSAFEYIRNSAMDAANLFDSAASSGINAAGQVRRLPPFVRNNFGGSFGGPIRKNKTFFFAVFEGVQERKGLTLNGTALGDGNFNTKNCRLLVNNPCTTPAGGTVSAIIAPFLGNVPGGTLPYLQRPTAITTGSLPTSPTTTAPFSFAFTRPISEQYGQIRLDHSFSANDTAFARYTIDVAVLSQPNGSAPNQNEIDHLKSGTQFTTISETHIFTTSLLNTARFSISRTPQELGNQMPSYIPPGSTTPTTFISGVPVSLGIGNIAVGGGVTGFSAGIPAHHDQKIYGISDDVFYTKGRNAFKMGVLITNWKQRMELQNAYRGALSFNAITNFLTGTDPNSSNGYSGTTPGSIIRRDYTSGTLGFYIQDDIRLTPRLTLNAGLRYEFLAPNFREVNGYQAALRNLYTDAQTTVGPVIKNRTDKDFSPRLGFAWDVFGDGKTSVRGGGALLFDVGNIAPVLYRSASTTPPFASSSQVTGGAGSCTTTQFPLQIPFVFPACAVGSTLTLQDYNMRPAHLLVYNLTVERQLPWGVGIAVGYAGSKGYDIINITEGNPILPTATVNGRPEWQGVFCNGVLSGGAQCLAGQNPALVQTGTNPLLRVNKNVGSITLMGSTANSWYNSLQTVLTKRLQNGLQFQGSYTWSKNVDEGSGFGAADNSTASWNPINPIDNRAASGFDVSHNLRFNTIYHLPQFVKNGGIVGGFANGWWASMILSWQTGYPFTPTEGSNRSDSGVMTNLGDRPDLVPGVNLANIYSGTSAGCAGVLAGTALGTTAHWFDPCAFQLSQLGFLGTAGRNILRGPGLSNVDISIDKDTPLKFLGENGQLQFRAEIFNIFNHPSLAIPNSSIFTGSTANSTDTVLGNAGLIQNTSTQSRQVQLALKVVF